MCPLALVVVIVPAEAAARTTRIGAVRWGLRACAALSVLAWIPLLGALAIDPSGDLYGNGLGLGLCAWAGTLVGVLGMGIGLVIRAFER